MFSSNFGFGLIALAKTTVLASVVFLLFGTVSEVSAQKRFTRTYPAGQHVRLRLTNKTGTVTVEGWNRQEVRVEAAMESSNTNIVPQSLSGEIVIDLIKDNQSRDIGYVNFVVRVPFNSKVDIETRIGNLIVSNVRSGLVRAYISSEGDITLTNIAATHVSAENGLGDIFFDGEIMQGGIYRFASMKGTINLRIPFTSSFKLVATAPSTRNITLGPFANSSLSYVGDGRRVTGRFGDGSATLTVTNQRGGIGFISR